MLCIIPEYIENNWIKTSDGTIEIDFSGKTGNINFVLWVKLEDKEGNKYYDQSTYSTKIENEITITLDKSTAEIKEGETLTLKATVSDGSKVEWSSSDENVATVNEDGVVTGISEGVATITAKVGEKTDTCVVTIKKAKDDEETAQGNTDTENTEETTQENTETEKDETVMPIKELPQTGIKSGIASVISIIILLGIVMLKKYLKFRDVK